MWYASAMQCTHTTEPPYICEFERQNNGWCRRYSSTIISFNENDHTNAGKRSHGQAIDRSYRRCTRVFALLEGGKYPPRPSTMTTMVFLGLRRFCLRYPNPWHSKSVHGTKRFYGGQRQRWSVTSYSRAPCGADVCCVV